MTKENHVIASKKSHLCYLNKIVGLRCYTDKYSDCLTDQCTLILTKNEPDFGILPPRNHIFVSSLDKNTEINIELLTDEFLF